MLRNYRSYGKGIYSPSANYDRWAFAALPFQLSHNTRQSPDFPYSIKTPSERASITATANLSASAIRNYYGQASVTATANLSASAIRNYYGQASVTATAILSAVAIRISYGQASVTSSAILSAVAIRISYGQASITATANLVYDQISITASAILSANASVKVGLNAQIICSGSVTTNASKLFYASGLIGCIANILADGERRTIGQVSIFTNINLLTNYKVLEGWRDIQAGVADNWQDIL